MPIYEFRCLDCDSVFDELVRDPDTTSVSCSHCDSAHTERLLSAFAVNSSSPGRSDSRSSPPPPPPTGPCGSSCGCF